MRPLDLAPTWVGVVTSGIFGAFLTPVFEAVLLWGLEVTALDTAVSAPVDQQPSPLSPPPIHHPDVVTLLPGSDAGPRPPLG